MSNKSCAIIINYDIIPILKTLKSKVLVFKYLTHVDNRRNYSFKA